MRIKDDVLTVLSSAITEGNAVTLTGQLDRKLYVETNKVLEAAGGKWNRSAKAHLFEDAEAAKRIDDIILTGEVEIPKDDFDFFPSPEAVVNQALNYLGEIKPGQLLLEPSAGVGAIALAAARRGAVVQCYEFSPVNFKALSEKAELMRVVQADFLTVEPQPIYDFVVMNPPFSSQRDIDHILHAYRFLKPGGRLVSVASASVGFRSNRKTVEFRELVESCGFIEPMSEGSFKESGTMVRTVFVVMDKED